MLHEVLKGGAGVPCLLEPHLVLQDHERVDQALCDCVRQEILILYVLKAAMEVPHPVDVSGGKCLQNLPLNRLLNVESLFYLPQVFDLRLHKVP